ncbi:MAG: tripartite tricarboxylate transporter substrate-binding protein [Woeseiaceae bacterium]|nr:tripartite tricarboxylate transporter substrate-binding protein [Woeseiaceae bacterium]
MSRISHALVLLLLIFSAGRLHALESVHFLVPGGAGGGWDTTARVVGRTLMESGLIDTVSFENLSGASGGKGVSHLVETALQNQHVLLINSTPIIARSLIPAYGQSWRDLTPIASVIGDYGAITVRDDSRFRTIGEMLSELQADARSLTFAGGSTRGGLDHLIIASVFRETGLKPMDARYVPYDAGGKALFALLSGEVDALSATVGDAIAAARDGRVRVLAITAPERLAELPDVPTFAELGYPVELLNWRGFFAAPGIPAERRAEFVDLLQRLRAEDDWRRQVARYGWIEKFLAGDEFVAYLQRQEDFIGGLMRELGFIGTVR